MFQLPLKWPIKHELCISIDVSLLNRAGHAQFVIAYANSLIFTSISDTKNVFCFILQSVDSVQELVWFCCLFKFYRVRLVRINIIIRSTHIYSRFTQTFLLQLMKMLEALNVTINTTGICQWCWHLKQCITEQVQWRLVKETSF